MAGCVGKQPALTEAGYAITGKGDLPEFYLNHIASAEIADLNEYLSGEVCLQRSIKYTKIIFLNASISATLAAERISSQAERRARKHEFLSKKGDCILCAFSFFCASYMTGKLFRETFTNI